MNPPSRRWPKAVLFIATQMVAMLIPFASLTSAADEIDFSRDVRPILANACFHCHGADASSREAELRLDQPAGLALVVSSDDGESELLNRIKATDPDILMPPPAEGKALSADQIRVLEKWIAGGADSQEHWAFTLPEKTEPRANDLADPWVQHPIDAFVLAKLKTVGLTPSEPADRPTLIRRLSFDLTGMPPTWQEVQAFVNDDSPQAIEKVVDRLLQSTAYGERMAQDWLDAARYADTDGYQGDQTRTNWPWRDWVVRAFNQNMPFNQFTIEQFAGDLLPDATADQVIATCFHRNHMTNGEGGRDPEESRIDYVIDRVNTMGTVWLGLTLGCTQCHSHKYDPISHAEYYSLNAFFNSIDEDGKAGGGAKPFYEYQSNSIRSNIEQGIRDSEQWLDSMQQRLAATESTALEMFPAWIKDQFDRFRDNATFQSWHVPSVQQLESTNGATLRMSDNGEIHVSGRNARHEDYRMHMRPKQKQVTGMKLTVLPQSETQTLSVDDSGHFIMTNMKINVARRGSSQVREIIVDSSLADYEKEKTGRSYGPVATLLDDDPRSGWTSLGADPRESRTAVFGFKEQLALADDEYIALEFRHRSLTGFVNIRRFRVEFTDEVGPALRTWKRTPLEKLAGSRDFTALDESTQSQLREQFLVTNIDVTAARHDLRRAEQRHRTWQEAQNPIKVMVLGERERPRETNVLLRGEWDKKGPRVEREVPKVLHKLPRDAANVAANNSPDRPVATPTRLDLARWLVDRKNPLTARVTVNRIWQMLLGHGLVRTPDDFGTQGDLPTHPRLLDWLAVDFMESNWDVKRLVKQIVLTSTYQQSSVVTEELRLRDPANELLSRSNRYRLPSWMIRDAALKSSGLLDERLGGPPVFPLQPPGAWADATMGRFHYESSVGNDLYRKSLYSFWRRSVAPTAFFDASKRRNCEVRQVRTNTPLHALNLLNDETYVEAARNLATRAIRQQPNPAQQIEFMVQSVLSRSPTDRESQLLTQQLEALQSIYVREIESAKRFTNIGQSASPDDLRPDRLAALTAVASIVMNMDEAITRE